MRQEEGVEEVVELYIYSKALWWVVMAVMGGVELEADLLHNTSLSLRESDVATRFVLDELDFYLPALTARLIIIIIVVVGSVADARALCTAILNSGGSSGGSSSSSRSSAIAPGDEVVLGGRRVFVSDGGDISHGGGVTGVDDEMMRLKLYRVV